MHRLVRNEPNMPNYIVTSINQITDFVQKLTTNVYYFTQEYFHAYQLFLVAILNFRSQIHLKSIQ